MDESTTRRTGKLCFSANAVFQILNGQVELHGNTTYSMCGMFLRVLVFLVTILILAAKWIKDLLNEAQKSAPSLPKMYYKNTPLLQHLLTNCKILSEPFQATFWARNGHVQTLLWKMLPHEDVTFKREHLEMENNGIVGLDWADEPVNNDKQMYKGNRPILVIVPDIASDCYDVAQLCWESNRRGYRPVVFNRRGHAGVSLVTAKLQSFGDTSDLREAIRYIHRTNRHSQICGVGIAGGCGLLISYLGEHGSSTDLSAAVCISPTYNYQDCIRNLRQPYQWLMLQKYKYFLTRHCDLLSTTIDLDKAFASSSLDAWEENVYGSMHNLKDKDDYWDQNSPLREVDDIAVPLLCVNATDDPISPVEELPYDLFTTLPNVLLVTTKYGGHCGFYEGLRPTSWALRLTMDYIDSVLQYSALIKVNNNS